jgi:DNA polymerase III gamma/tau subunit
MNKKQSYSLDDLVGNESTITMIRKSLEDGTFPAFSVFSGDLGTGKSTSASIAALTLLCEEKIDGKPCFSCSNCKDVMKAVTTGEGLRCSRKNFGLLDKKADVNELIKEVFRLSANGVCVYIFEEFHSLPSNLQIAFLEEIDLLREDVYIIICTTKAYRIIPELLSRAIIFEFKKLNRKDSERLLKYVLTSRNITISSENTRNRILQYSGGIPRNIINTVDFLMSGDKTVEDIEKFLNVISTDNFFVLLTALNGDFGSFIGVLEGILEEFSSAFVSQLKAFWVDFVFSRDVSILDKKKCQSLRDFLGEDMILRITRKISTLSSNMSEVDLKLAVLDMFYMVRSVQRKSVTTPVVEQVSVAENMADIFMDISETSKLKKINLSKLLIKS